MHSAFKVMLVFPNLAIAFAYGFTNNEIVRRKSLSFNPSLPHAVHTTNPPPILASWRPLSDPINVARSFLDNHLADLDPNLHTSYVVRNDSYKDVRTGVTHVYVNQFVNGLEVINARININIKSGKVLSYGDSFYRGPLPTLGLAEPQIISPHAEFCTILTARIQNLQSQQFHHNSLGVDWDNPSFQRYSSEIQLLKDIYTTDCTFLTRRLSLHPVNVLRPDPSAAALMFMLAATPDKTLADDIHLQFEEYLSEIVPLQHSESDTPGLWQISKVPDVISPVKARMAYVQVLKSDGDVTLKHVWQLEVEMQNNWYSALIDVFNPSNIISVVDWTSDYSAVPTLPPPESQNSSTYTVFKWGINDPSVGNRTIEKENFDNLASPMGWHTLPVSKLPQGFGRLSTAGEDGNQIYNPNITCGNNVCAQENWDSGEDWVNNHRPTANAKSQFDFMYAPEMSNRTDPIAVAREYIDAAVTQLFYTANMVHDLYYRYGFDEVSGNFQQYNFGRGGKEDDAIIADAQDGQGFKMAFFSAPPDGQHGRCSMYLWNTAEPYRDGVFDAGIVIHELSHGLSVRLTGGPANSDCLKSGEASGMGEGWSDFLATSIRSTSNYSDYTIGAWAENDKDGARGSIYSLDTNVNPTTYGTLNGKWWTGDYAIGEIWAEILWVVQNRLVNKHGFSETLYPPKPDQDGVVPHDGVFYRRRVGMKKKNGNILVPAHGNTLFLQLVIDGMKLQPCDPRLVDARDAIILADEILTGGENYCTLWKGFAERGLGLNAKLIETLPWEKSHVEDFQIPSSCSTAGI